MTLTLNPHALAILTALAPLEALTQPIRVGDGKAPLSTDEKVVAPCAVLHFRPGGEMFESVGCMAEDAAVRFQVTCVGRTAAQARIVADEVAEALEGATLTVSGRAVYRVRRTSPVGGAPERDDDVSPPLFYIPALYSLMTASA